jgi:hypothetical protein
MRRMISRAGVAVLIVKRIVHRRDGIRSGARDELRVGFHFLSNSQFGTEQEHFSFFLLSEGLLRLKM